MQNNKRAGRGEKDNHPASHSDELGGRALEWCKAAVYMKKKADEMDPRKDKKEQL